MKSPTTPKKFILSFIFILTIITAHGQLINGWRFHGSVVGYGVDVTEFAESTSNIAPDKRDSGLGFQLDVGFRSNDKLFHGIVYTRYSGSLSQGGAYAINSIQGAVGYDINIKGDVFKIVPQVAMGPQYFTKKRDGRKSYTHSDPFQTRYKLGAEVKFQSQWYLNASFQYSHNLFGIIYNHTVSDSMRNITSINFSLGITYYLR